MTCDFLVVQYSLRDETVVIIMSCKAYIYGFSAVE